MKLPVLWLLLERTFVQGALIIFIDGSNPHTCLGFGISYSGI
nr:hypothetical protein [Desulfitobacterium hafniense]